ncbi:MAG: hypothetical protein ABEI74_02155 [Candidatus Pacearchaeota archaeon]
MGNIEEFIKNSIDKNREIQFLDTCFQKLRRDGAPLGYEEFINKNLDIYNNYRTKYEIRESKYMALMDAVEEVRDYQAKKRFSGILGSDRH